MSVEQEIQDLVADADGISSSVTVKAIALAAEEVRTLLHATHDSLFAICSTVEGASTREALKAGFLRFNAITGMLMEAATAPEHDGLLRECLSSFQLTGRLEAELATADSVRAALDAYKGAVVKQLAARMAPQKSQVELQNTKDDELLSRFLPQKDLPDPGVRRVGVDPVSADASLGGSITSQKRGVSAIADGDGPIKIPRLSKIPALAALHRIPGGTRKDGAPNKRALFTREMLRAAQLDPRALLELECKSSNALERTKKLELLKCAGWEFDIEGSKGKKSFAQKLNAATLRLDLGLGGFSSKDTLLFGAKVLSSPGFLTPKNITDIEHNMVEGKTTWKHQDAYSKMMIAGCMRQAIMICNHFDEVLFGPAPEAIIESTHSAIRELLTSKDCGEFLRHITCSEEDSVSKCDSFVKRIVEAVSPIIPISLRNRSLDGAYLRSALHLLSAAELLFSQYVQDVRMQANPAGVVGMCASMHAQLERAAIYSDELKSLRDFRKENRAQYQTYLGLGSPFPKDSPPRNRRSGRSSRGRAYRFRTQGLSRFQQSGTPETSPAMAYDQGFTGNQVGQRSINSLARGVRGRARGYCFDYRAGVCQRGASCRFLHHDL